MKTFRRLCLAIALMAAFTVPARAGELQTPGAPNPGETQTPPGDGHGTGSAAPGDIGTPGLSVTSDSYSRAWTTAILAMPDLFF